jgi:hypothetical protein
MSKPEIILEYICILFLFDTFFMIENTREAEKKLCCMACDGKLEVGGVPT